MRALCLSGGGGLGAYQVGALGFMLGVLKKQYQIIRGVSVGSVNGAMVAMTPIGKEPEAAAVLDKMWRELRSKDVVSPHFVQPVSLLWNPSTHSFDPLHSLLMDRLDIEKMKSSGRDYGAVAVDICSGDFRVYGPDCGSKEQLVRGILGSSATPILHPNIKHGDDILYDGGIRDVSPIRQAIQAGATEIDLILCQSPKLSKWNPNPDRVWNTGLRVFEIMFREIVENDLERCEDINALVEARHPRGVGKRTIDLRVIRPTEPLPGDAAQFEPDQSADLIALGRRDAENYPGW